MVVALFPGLISLPTVDFRIRIWILRLDTDNLKFINNYMV
jgi:hypothetical protein